MIASSHCSFSICLSYFIFTFTLFIVLYLERLISSCQQLFKRIEKIHFHQLFACFSLFVKVWRRVKKRGFLETRWYVGVPNSGPASCFTTKSLPSSAFLRFYHLVCLFVWLFVWSVGWLVVWLVGWLAVCRLQRHFVDTFCHRGFCLELRRCLGRNSNT